MIQKDSCSNFGKKYVKFVDSRVESNTSTQFKKAWKNITKLCPMFDGYFSHLSIFDDENDDIGEIEKMSMEDRKRFADLFNSENIADERSSHCLKNLGVELLGNSIHLPIQDIFAHAGWIVKNFNTFFDYWHGTNKSLTRTGKTLAGWSTTNANSNVNGGM